MATSSIIASTQILYKGDVSPLPSDFGDDEQGPAPGLGGSRQSVRFPCKVYASVLPHRCVLSFDPHSPLHHSMQISDVGTMFGQLLYMHVLQPPSTTLWASNIVTRIC